jgi:hypothetical protein
MVQLSVLEPYHNPFCEKSNGIRKEEREKERNKKKKKNNKNSDLPKLLCWTHTLRS